MREKRRMNVEIKRFMEYNEILIEATGCRKKAV